jgi:manganese transport protein
MIRDPVSVAARTDSAVARRHPVLALLGPAFVAAVAYVDPGNFATNITAGARYGYLLCWVVLTANLAAMLVQYLSAKLGMATGHDLPELCRVCLPHPVSVGLWVQAELVAMATDLAEFVGAAIGLNLLFGVPLPAAGLITAFLAFAVLALEQRGLRRFELAIAALFGVVLLGFAYDLTAIGPEPAGIAVGLVPRFTDGPSVVLAVGIVGATVMPHVVYLHSSLTARQARDTSDIPTSGRLRSLRLDVVLALGAASLVNLAMLAMAATLLHHTGITGADPILLAHTDLGRAIGGGAALVFAVALLASGLSSSSVGTYAGQVVMRGFLRRSMPLFARRAITLLPALAVLALRLPPIDILVISQVVLSFGIPFALVPLVWLTRRTDVMGALANHPITTLTGSGCTLLITAMNVALIVAAL